MVPIELQELQDKDATTFQMTQARFTLTDRWIVIEALAWARQEDPTVGAMAVIFEDGHIERYSEATLGTKEVTVHSPICRGFTSPPLLRSERWDLLRTIQLKIKTTVHEVTSR